MRKGSLAAAAVVSIIGLGSGAWPKSMADVFAQCQDQRPFPKYGACVKTAYAAKGDLRNSGPVLAFLAYFDELIENFEKSQGTAEPMTEIKARAETFRIWQATIEADDKARRGQSGRTTSCTPTTNGAMICIEL